MRIGKQISGSGSERKMQKIKVKQMRFYKLMLIKNKDKVFFTKSKSKIKKRGEYFKELLDTTIMTKQLK